MENITVIGSGTMGNGIAHVFSLYDYKINLVDINDDLLKKASKSISVNMDRQVAKEIITGAHKDLSFKNITFSTNLNESLLKADLVIEAVSENVDIKKDVFSQISKIAPEDCLLATNTSSISITKIASFTARPERVIGMHFMNPVPIMPLVEIINGYNTSSETTKSIVSLAENIDKTPIVVNDYPGFIANRILMPMINEAIYALFEGAGGVREIDSIMKLGMAHPMGPLQLADFIGLDVCHSILNVLYKGFGNPKYAPCPLLGNMVEAGHLGAKTGMGFYDWSEGSKSLKVSSQFV